MWNGCVGEPGEPPFWQRSVGDDDELVPGGGHARPAVGGVEEMAADHGDLDGVPEGLNVVRGGAADAKRPLVVDVDRHVAVPVPVEQWSYRVVGIGDVAVRRNHGLHDNSCHLIRSSTHLNFLGLAGPEC